MEIIGGGVGWKRGKEGEGVLYKCLHYTNKGNTKHKTWTTSKELGRRGNRSTDVIAQGVIIKGAFL